MELTGNQDVVNKMIEFCNETDFLKSYPAIRLNAGKYPWIGIGPSTLSRLLPGNICSHFVRTKMVACVEWISGKARKHEPQVSTVEFEPERWRQGALMAKKPL